MVVTELLAQNAKYDFQIIEFFDCTSMSKKKFVPTEHTNICRFCEKKEPEVCFRKEAHAIPQFMGNRYLLSHNKCDSCNHFFGSTLEDQYSNYFAIPHSIQGVPGRKNRPPDYKTFNGNTRISNNRDRLDFTTVNDKGTIRFYQDAEGLTIEFNDSTAEYVKSLIDNDSKILKEYLDAPRIVPILIYKTFLKVSLSLMLDQEIENFS